MQHLVPAVIFTYQDAQAADVDEDYATSNLVQARDHAARHHRRLIANMVTLTSWAVAEDYTQEDEADV